MFEKKYLTPLCLKVLHFLSLHEGEEHYLRDIAYKLKRSPSGCHSAVKTLVQLGLVMKRRSGKNLYLTVNRNDPSIRALKVFFNLSDISTLLSPWKGDVLRVVLFGSCSRGEDTYRSDIDLFIIAEDVGSVHNGLRGMTLDGRPVRARIVTSSESMSMREEERPFMDEIDKGIVIWRGVDE